MESEVRLTSFLLKVASRCNLDCDYCYVYHHADQSWRSMPRILSMEDRLAFVGQLYTYVKEKELRQCVVIFHGGEPLLMGVPELVEFAQLIRDSLSETIQVDISLQTNGILLTELALDKLKKANIGVSLSLDGPKEANDLHRTTRRGRSSFAKALSALELLKKTPEVFSGVISVIDPSIEPRKLFEFFNAHQVPKLDFLLPDAHYLRPPPGRSEKTDLYQDWLLEAFDLWFDEFPHLKIRTFEALLDGIVGLPSETDAFGFGDVSLVTIETDGSYHDLDVMKVVGDGVTKIIGNVQTTSISKIARSEVLKSHRSLLKKDGLCEKCQECEIVDICGGGAVPHRFNHGGFKNPTIYCKEITALVKHAQNRVKIALSETSMSRLVDGDMSIRKLKRFERAEMSNDIISSLWESSVSEQKLGVESALMSLSEKDTKFKREVADKLIEYTGVISQQPGAIAWSRTMNSIENGLTVCRVDGTRLNIDKTYPRWLLDNVEKFKRGTLLLHLNDSWLRVPFGNSIIFERTETALDAELVFYNAIEIIEKWRPALLNEINSICKSVQFVRDPSADPNKIVSFSDNSVPGALYVSVVQGGKLIDAYDLADSIIHEYRHQKLYLLEKQYQIVENSDNKVPSPWREDMRPPSGLFHAIFVFVELRRFWTYIRSKNIPHMQIRAENQLSDTNKNLEIAFNTLANCRLTKTGLRLGEVLLKSAKE
ncbi:cyclophane-forming radical SAM/SPASM peptide maturase YhhB [Hahella aquimaris]|uniref:cyclophane-forming radical SAM/SPASM peptide maturase YhhB n=1 Tax=Hahella sp. HNIBRBA332 TaxID=3015983 RepID=UPI00273B2A96|nr:cyclophane-forming radical SAM/SPASM peptide maturase YhhB [Hahella sp. HNIBRBA332]WLQ16502.1 cyclophane-forming radical SAM/SPASM peptide maturase YhhB [Hahella sp. HNIBRBA332]